MRVVKSKLTLVVGSALAVILAFSQGSVREARANDPDTMRTLKTLARQAMENYDLMEYEEAKRLLNRSIALAKKKRLNDHPLTAQLYLHLGIVYFSGFQDVESAKVAFIDAVSIDPEIILNPAYKTGEMEKLLENARREFGGTGGGGSSGGGGAADPEPAPSVPDVNCDELVGISHTLVDSAEQGTDTPVSAHVSPQLEAAKVALYYRTQGKTDFAEVQMGKRGSCTFTGKVPGDDMKGEVVHYYIAVFNEGGKTIAKKGSAASPNIMELVASSGTVSSAGGGSDIENPLGGGGGGRVTGSGGEVSGGVTSTGGSKLYVALGVGSGGGYVSGQTEQAQQDVSCCFAPALFHVLPEIGYRLSAKQTVSLAFRLGLPVGADLPGHATAAPAAFARFRHALSPGGGLELSGILGGGIIRHTVPLAGDMGTDTSATGPLLLGGGAGYRKPFSDSLDFIAELNVIAGIPIVSDIGASEANFALQVDANVGLQLGF